MRSAPEALWPLIADTNRFDHDAGLPAVERMAGESSPGNRGSRADAGAGTDAGAIRSTRVRSRVLGIPVEWDEQPFEWVRPSRFGVLRTYRTGPVTRMRLLVELAATPDGGSLVAYQLWIQPRHWIAALLLPAALQLGLRKRFAETFRRYDAALAESAASSGTPASEAPAAGSVRFASGGQTRLHAARLELLGQRAASEALVQQLVGVIETADELALLRMRPYAFADRWGARRRDTLELFLRATRAGLLDLHWDLLCPACRGAAASNLHLAEVNRQVHCEACDIDFSVNFERSVELTFAPNAAIRPVNARDYCVGSPGATPHVVVQQMLPPHSERELTPVLEPGRYRLRAAGLPGVWPFLVAPDDGAPAATLPVSDDGWPDEELRLAPKPILRMRNETARSRLVHIERTAWSDQAATAAEVTALQVFRDLFSTEALRPGEQISVGNLAVLFTDLRDSTRLYREIGDAPAFGRVMSHFDALRDAVAAQDGAVVKTIGDAVMAVFRRPVAALQAVLRAQRAVSAIAPGGRSLALKAGIHLGPCIAVTLNGRLDYFGSTVNLAARLHRFSSGNDVVISQAMRSDPEVAEWLRSPSAAVGMETFSSALKGFDEERFELCRVRQV